MLTKVYPDLHALIHQPPRRHSPPTSPSPLPGNPNIRREQLPARVRHTRPAVVRVETAPHQVARSVRRAGACRGTARYLDYFPSAFASDILISPSTFLSHGQRHLFEENVHRIVFTPLEPHICTHSYFLSSWHLRFGMFFFFLASRRLGWTAASELD